MNPRRRAILMGLPVLLLTTPVVHAQDSAATPQHGGIVFVGSSIFAFWTHLTEQMAPLPVLNRGIPGTVTGDWLARINQVLQLQPRIVVYYCGSNDVGSGEDAGPIIERTKRFIQLLHEKSPATYFYYASINKAPDKRDRWNIVDQVNREMERFSREARNVGYLDMNTVLFDAKGNLRENLFLGDQLHFRPNGQAYPEFAAIFKPVLTKAWASGVGLGK